MLLYRVQMDADDTGIIQPQSVQAFDTSIDLDPITDKPTRGQLRPISLSEETKIKIAALVNEELGGIDKGQERLQDLRAEAKSAEQTAAAVVVTSPTSPSDPASP